MRNPLRPLHLLALPLLLVLISCGTLGTASPQTFNQKLAYAVGVHTAVLQTATLGLQNGALSTDDADQILKLADDSRAVLDGAQSLSTAGNTAGANDKLTLALTGLQALQTFLQNRGIK